MAAGVAYPRTCEACGVFGPCVKGYSAKWTPNNPIGVGPSTGSIMAIETLRVTYCGEDFTLRREGDGYWVSDPEVPCVLKSVRLVGDTLTLELNIRTGCE
jgi:hypothetical protein